MGNPYLPEIPEKGFFLDKDFPLSIKAGYQGSFVAQRQLDLKGESISPLPQRESLTYHVNMGVVSVGFYDRVEAYAGLGVGKFLMSGPIDFSIVRSASNENFLWEGGGRVLLIFWKGTSLGVSAGYQRAGPDMDWLTINDAPGSTKGSELNYSQWQVAIGIAHKIGFFSPYIGGSYSYVKYKIGTPVYKTILHDTKSSKTYQNKKKLSLIVGASLTATEIINLDIEIKTFAEKSLTISSCFRF